MQLEDHVETLLERIMVLREEHAGQKILAFWDFDGTILKGDCCEGLAGEYKGLVEVGIEGGYSLRYRPGELAKARADYAEKYQRSVYEAYVSVPLVFAGRELDAMRNLAKDYFATTLREYYFSSSLYILDQLEQLQVESHIVSASPGFFVEAAAETLGLPVERFNGIEVKIESGLIADEVLQPVTYGHGKLEVVKSLQQAHEGKALLGFGNSYGTDGPFLRYIVREEKGLATMINGGEEKEEFKMFQQVKQDKVVGS